MLSLTCSEHVWLYSRLQVNNVWVFVYEKVIADQMSEGVVLHCKEEVSHGVVAVVVQPVKLVTCPLYTMISTTTKTHQSRFHSTS